MSAVECRSVTRRFGDVVAVDEVSLTVHDHEIFGLIGPNGSGKTTLLDQMQGLDTPTAGQVRVLGLDPGHDHTELAERMGSQLQEAAIIPRLTVGEAVRTFAAFYRRHVDVDALLERLDLTAKTGTRIERLSGGQRQRMFIALALVHDPELLFFDELTSAVDPTGKRAIWDILRGLREAGHTIVLTTHSMQEAEELCDRVAIIDHGRIIAMGTPAELVATHAGGSTLTVTVADGIDPAELDALPDVIQTEMRDHRLTVRGRGDFATAVLERLLAAGARPREMQHHRAGLEEVYLALTGRPAENGDDEDGTEPPAAAPRQRSRRRKGH